MIKRLLALLLAGVMVFSLAGCGEKQTDADVTEPPNGNIEPLPPEGDVTEPTAPDTKDPEILSEAPVEEAAIPEDLDILLSALSDNGYTAEYEILDNEGSDFFLYPDLDFNSVIEVSNGEKIYLYGYMDVEKGEEHIACYGHQGSEYTTDEKSVIIDYIAPVHFWLTNGWVIEYASQSGELMGTINDTFGNEDVGAGIEVYIPQFVWDFYLEFLDEEHDITIPSLVDDRVNPNAAVYSAMIDGNNKVYIFHYNTLEEFLSHNSSPIPVPVLETVPEWADSQNLNVIQYSGEDENIIKILDNAYSKKPKQVAVRNAVRIRGDYMGQSNDPDITVITDHEQFARMFDVYRYELEPFDEAWFDTHIMIVAGITEGSGSIGHELMGVTKSDEDITLHINRILPEIGTCDIAYWHIIVGIDKDEYNSHCEIKVSLTSPDEGDKRFEYLGTVDENIVRTDSYDYGHEDEVVIINSFKELESYYSNNKDRFFLEGRDTVYADTSIGFTDTFSTYNEEWFKENILIMGIVEEGSGSIRHRLDGIVLEDDGKLSLRYTPLIPCVVTADMACWHIMAGVKRSDIPEAAKDTLYIFKNEGISVDRTLFPAEYITPERLSDVKKSMIGNYVVGDVRNFWGEPDGTLSGMWGEIYLTGEDSRVCVYYDGNGVVEEVLLTVNGKTVIPLSDVTVDSVESIEKLLVGDKRTYQELAAMWGEADESFGDVNQKTWHIRDSMSVNAYFMNNVIYSLSIYAKMPFDGIPDYRLIYSQTVLDGAKEHFVGRYSYEDIVNAWGRPNEETDGIGAVRYIFNEHSYLEVTFDSKGIINDVYIEVDVPKLNEITKENAEALEKKLIDGGFTCFELELAWGEPDGTLSGMWGEIYNISDDTAICVYYNSNATVEEILLTLSGKHVYTLEDITEDSFESIKKIIIDQKWTLEELEKVWGEPSHKDQSDKSYTWDLSSGVSLVVTEFEYVDTIVPYVKNPLDSIPWLSVVSNSNLKAVSEHLVGNYTIVDIWDAWGEPKGALYEEVAYGYEISDGGIIWVYYKGTEGYVEKLVITYNILFVEDFALENVTADNIIQFETFFMGSTYKEVVDFWGKPDEETAGVGQALYQISENMFVAINFNSDSLVENMELVSRTPLATQ